MQNQHDGIERTYPVSSQIDKSVSFQRLTDLLKEMYFSMVVYREAVKNGNIQEINIKSEVMQNSAWKIFLFYEYNQFSDKENADKAKQLVDRYNLFIEYYGQFISFTPGESRMSAEAQKYAKKAEGIFNSLMANILNALYDKTDE